MSQDAVQQGTGASPAVDASIVVETAATVKPHSSARVLITNDDGIDSPGIVQLVEWLEGEFDVTVAAPSRDWSGAGTSIGRFDPRAGIPLHRVQLGSVRAFSIDGPPGLAVMAAALGAFGDRFDVVVSGINAGINTGHSIIHSGTVGAALTARTFGSHGVAISLVPSDPWRWSTAAEIGLAAVRWITAVEHPATTISINVPNLDIAQVLGLRHADLDDFGYFRVAIADETDQKLEFEVLSDTDDPAEGSDTWLLRQGYATITALGQLTGTIIGLPSDLTQIWHP